MTNNNRWWHFGIFNPYGNFNLKRQGKIDGKLSIPPWTSEEQPDFLRGLYHVTQTTLEALGEAWHKLDRLSQPESGAVARHRCRDRRPGDREH